MCQTLTLPSQWRGLSWGWFPITWRSVLRHNPIYIGWSYSGPLLRGDSGFSLLDGARSVGADAFLRIEPYAAGQLRERG